MFALVTVSLAVGTTWVPAWTTVAPSVVFCTMTTWFAPPLGSAPAEPTRPSVVSRAQKAVRIRRLLAIAKGKTAEAGLRLRPAAKLVVQRVPLYGNTPCSCDESH